jgi:predicted HD phosphohydrolase
MSALALRPHALRTASATWLIGATLACCHDPAHAVADGYFDPTWAREILDRRVRKRTIRVSRDHFRQEILERRVRLVEGFGVRVERHTGRSRSSAGRHAVQRSAKATAGLIGDLGPSNAP